MTEKHVNEICRRIQYLEQDLDSLKEKIGVTEKTSIKELYGKTNFTPLYQDQPTCKMVSFAPSKKTIRIKVKSKKAISNEEDRFKKDDYALDKKGNEVSSCPVLDCPKNRSQNTFENNETNESLTFSSMSTTYTSDTFKIMDSGNDYRNNKVNSESKEEMGIELSSGTMKKLKDEKSLSKHLMAENNELQEKLKWTKKYIPQVFNFKKKLKEEKILRKDLQNRFTEYKTEFEKRYAKHKEDVEKLAKALKEEKLCRYEAEIRLQEMSEALFTNEKQCKEFKDGKKLDHEGSYQMKENYEGPLSQKLVPDLNNKELEEQISFLVAALESQKNKCQLKSEENKKLMKLLDEALDIREKERDKLEYLLNSKLESLKIELEKTTKELLEYQQRDPLEDPRVVEVLEKLKNRNLDLMSGWEKSDRELKEKHDAIQKNLEQEIEDQYEKVAVVKAMVSQLQNEIDKKDSTIEILNQKLKHIFDVLEVERKRSDSTTNVQLQQENLIKTLNDTISFKENQIEMLFKDLSSCKKNYGELEKQMTELKNQKCNLDSENHQLKLTYNTEKDKSSLKDIMLNEQQETLKSLRESLEGSKTFLEKQMIDNEKLLEDVEHMAFHKNELKKRIMEMEDKISEYKRREAKSKTCFQQLEVKIKSFQNNGKPTGRRRWKHLNAEHPGVRPSKGRAWRP